MVKMVTVTFESLVSDNLEFVIFAVSGMAIEETENT
jgi:hypothetical protein